MLALAASHANNLHPILQQTTASAVVTTHWAVLNVYLRSSVLAESHALFDRLLGITADEAGGVCAAVGPGGER